MAFLTPETEREYHLGVMSIVDEGLEAEHLRERNRGRFDQRKRSWNVRPAKSRPVVFRERSATIAEVVAGPAEELPKRV